MAFNGRRPVGGPRVQPMWAVAVVLVGLLVAVPSVACGQARKAAGDEGGAVTSRPGEELEGEGVSPSRNGGYTYRPAGRRDPFASLFQMRVREQERFDRPPLQRYALSELTVTGILWSRDGYRAMVRTPDGKAYVVRPGTILGTNRGIVEDIRESALRVEEHVTDIYGRTREQVKVLPLHPSEDQ